jgi:outer membrane receptor protein involved in Fe transport
MASGPRAARVASLCLLAVGGLPVAAAAGPDSDDGPAKPVTEVIVTARRLDAARANIAPSLGAPTYTLTNEAVESRPGSETTSLGRVLLQAPGVMQDGSGQLNVRQSQGGLQYRINNVILPEGLTDLGESLSARIADKVRLVTGALPAQYGFQAGGVVDITTKSGVYLDGGQAELYGGGQGEYEPAVEYGGTLGGANVFGSASFHRTQTGLPSADGSARLSHDRSDQADVFGFLDQVLDKQTRLGLIAGASDDRFQRPNLRGVDAATFREPRALYQTPLTLGGSTHFASEALDDTRREANQFAVMSLLRSTEKVTAQAAMFARRSVTQESAGGPGDLLFHGLGLTSRDETRSVGAQLEVAYELAAAHTLRGGALASWDTLRSGAEQAALPLDAVGRQTSDQPRTAAEYVRVATRKLSAFAQDEWRPTDDLTVNAGLRFDDVSAGRRDSRVSPRVSAVWTLSGGTALHAGYARYFVPAPIDSAGEAPGELAHTTGATPSLASAAPLPEQDDYFDVGAQRDLGRLTLGLDAYWRQARNLIAEGQFGPANLARAFNYGEGRLRGFEASVTYADGPWLAWGNLAVARAEGRRIVSNQAWFSPDQLAYLARNFTPTPLDQTVTASAGGSYRWSRLQVSADGVLGSGLPTTPAGAAPNAAHLAAYAQLNLAAVWRLASFAQRPLDLRLDVMNVFDARYRLRDGRGLGDGPPQWGPRRGVFVGLEQAF